MNPAKYVSLGIYLGIGFAIVNILGNCGGGASTSQSAPNAPLTIQESRIDYRDFAPFRQSVIRTFSHGTYNSVVHPDRVDVSWGDSIEENRIREYAGEPWVMLDAYRNDKLGVRYAIKSTRVEIDYGQGWITLPNDTNPYVPVTISRPFTLRMWGIVADEVRFFWQHNITPPQLTYNSCWQGLGDSNRPAIRQDEVWWDESAGWFRGTGVLKDGLPTGEVVMGFFQTIGKDAGYVWTGSDGLCLVN